MHWWPERRERTLIREQDGERETWSILVSWECQDPIQRHTLHDLPSFCWADPLKGTSLPSSTIKWGPSL